MKPRRFLLGLIAVLLLLTGRAYATELSVTAASMAPGNWAQLSDAPVGFFIGNNSAQTLTFQGKAAWDPIGKQVMWVGNPHAGVSKFHVYTDATATWTEGPKIPGFPTSWSHGYNHNAIDAANRIFGVIDPTDESLTFMEYNLTTNTWRANATVANDGGVDGSMAYFPERATWVVPDGTQGKFREYNRNTNSWSVLFTNKSDCYTNLDGWSGESFAVYLPVRAEVAFGGGNVWPFNPSVKWCTVDAAGKYTVRPNAPHPLRIPEYDHPTIGSQIINDPVSGALIILTQDGKMFAFNFSSNTWLQVTGLPASMSESTHNVTNSTVVPISTYGVIMYVKMPRSGATPQIWLYKHAAGGSTPPPPPPPPSTDTTPPSIVQGLKAGSTTSSQIIFSWNASTDNIGVTSYKISRGSVAIGTSPTVSFQDSGLTPSTLYTYTVEAFDAAGNHSVPSAPISITTQGTSAPPPQPPPSSTGAANKATIYGTSGSGQSNRPVSIARPFRQGDIPNFAQAKIGNTLVLTQCDVKNRWPDGSLKFAIVSFVVPSLPANGPTDVEFVNQTSGQNTGFLTQSQMLSAGYNFDGEIQMTGGATTRTIKARTMLSNGHFRYWLKGPIVTAVIIEDRSPARTYDQDFGDGSKALHSVYEAWFYPQGNQVQLGYTVENIWASSTAANSMRDLSYSLTLKSGNANPTIEWTHGPFNHIVRTRWHKTYWLGTDPAKIRVDHNLPYLVTTGAIPHFDTTVTPLDSIENTRYATYQLYKGTLDGSDGPDSTKIGNYDKDDMNAGGEHDWIGLLNTWEVLWLYSMSDKGYEMVLGNADLAGRFPMNFREADTLAGVGNYFDQTYVQSTNLATKGVSAGTGSAETFGRIVSVNARQTITLSSVNFAGTVAEDKINIGSPNSTDGWGTLTRDHMPDVCGLAYMFSGSYYYLECLQMQAAYNITVSQAAWGSSWQRPGDVGLLNDPQIRGDAWGLKSITYAAFLSPDGEPEQAYFIDKVRDNVASWEGTQNLTLTYPGKQQVWNYGRKVRINESQLWKFPNGMPSPLGEWAAGDAFFIQNPLKNDGTLLRAVSPWEQNFMLNVLGMTNQMKVADTASLLKFMAKRKFRLSLSSVADRNTDLMYFHEAYREPTVETGSGNWVQNFDAFVSHYDKTVIPYTGRDSNAGGEHGYGFISLAADSFLTPYTVDGMNGQNAYNANSATVLNKSRYETSSPKWAITPMNTTQTTPLPDTVAPSPPSNLKLSIQ